MANGQCGRPSQFGEAPRILICCKKVQQALRGFIGSKMMLRILMAA
jgi:hypothetical protein